MKPASRNGRTDGGSHTHNYRPAKQIVMKLQVQLENYYSEVLMTGAYGLVMRK
jgi:hypothetical protein